MLLLCGKIVDACSNGQAALLQVYYGSNGTLFSGRFKLAPDRKSKII